MMIAFFWIDHAHLINLDYVHGFLNHNHNCVRITCVE